jgi:hypothetical protein
MNYYIIVEGIAEKKIYSSWIPVLNPSLKMVDFASQIDENNFYIISGGGYPAYLDLIEGAIDTINEIGNVDHLVIAVDSEDNTKDEKIDEINGMINGKYCSAQIYTIIQHFCIETWGLANIKIGPRNPKMEKVREYKSIHNVLTEDPELLPPNHNLGLNRAQFAFVYLKALFNDRQKQMTHSKSNPKTMMHKKYLEELINRYTDTGHIESFGDFFRFFQA